MKYLLVYNPKAGAGTKQLDNIVKVFSKKGIILDVYATQKMGDAINIAKHSKHDVIIAMGGDGTLNEVVNGMSKKQILAIIPSGTGNVVARNLGIPTDLIKAATLIIKGNTKNIDYGIINTRKFVIGAGVGLDAEVLKKVRPEIKKIFGGMAYNLSIVETLSTFTPKELIVITKHRLKKKIYCGYYVFAANLGKYSSNISKFNPLINIFPKARINDGKLHVIIFKSMNMTFGFKVVMGLLTGKHLKLKDVEYFQTNSLKVISKHKLGAHADAELVDGPPLDIKIVKKGLKIIVP